MIILPHVIEDKVTYKADKKLFPISLSGRADWKSSSKDRTIPFTTRCITPYPVTL